MLTMKLNYPLPLSAMLLIRLNFKRLTTKNRLELETMELCIVVFSTTLQLLPQSRNFSRCPQRPPIENCFHHK